jgi:hypothetical protein
MTLPPVAIVAQEDVVTLRRQPAEPATELTVQFYGHLGAELYEN